MNFRQHMHTKASFLLPTLSKIRMAELLHSFYPQYNIDFSLNTAYNINCSLNFSYRKELAMDLKQLEYIVKIAEENSITRAAEKLFITQSALNQQLLKLEKELGADLFVRSRTNWHLTEAGKIYIASAQKIISIKKDAYNRIYDLTEAQKGRLSVGFTHNRGTVMFSSVYPEFHKRHAGIIVKPVELSVEEQMHEIAQGNLDIGFLTLPAPKEKGPLGYVPIKKEEIFLAIPPRHPYSKYAQNNTLPFSEGDLYELREEPFVLMDQSSTIRPLIDPLFESCGFKPQVLFETTSTYTIIAMIESEICCGLIPGHYIDPSNKKICYFSLPSHPVWDIVACYNKNRYQSAAAKDFISIVQQFWNH